MPLRCGEEQAAILPQLSVRRGRAAVEFYKAAFGAVEDYRVGGTDHAEAVVAQLSVGPASFWVSDESPPHGNFSPESLGGGTVRIAADRRGPGVHSRAGHRRRCHGGLPGGRGAWLAPWACPG